MEKRYPENFSRMPWASNMAENIEKGYGLSIDMMRRTIVTYQTPRGLVCGNDPELSRPPRLALMNQIQKIVLELRSIDGANPAFLRAIRYMEAGMYVAWRARPLDQADDMKFTGWHGPAPDNDVLCYSRFGMRRAVLDADLDIPVNGLPGRAQSLQLATRSIANARMACKESREPLRADQERRLYQYGERALYVIDSIDNHECGESYPIMSPFNREFDRPPPASETRR